jgi:hypothetical protein
MGRRRLVPGEECRHGHPWNRTPDGKRCLTCYPSARRYSQLTVDERLDREAARQERLQRAQQQHSERAERAAQYRRARAVARQQEVKRRETQSRPAKDWLRYARLSLAAREKEAPSLGALRDLWLRQNGRCALTSVLLAGVTPSLDHIRSRLHGGTNDISNLRFVHPKVNYAKHSGTDDEFWSWIDAVIAEREKLF